MEVQLIVASGSRAGQAIPIQGDKFIIGRADDCHLKPRSELISRYHCAVITEDGYVAIRDLGSKNGVYVNGERIALECELKDGDKLSVGPLEFIIRVGTGTKTKRPKVESMEAVVARTVEIEAEQQKQRDIPVNEKAPEQQEEEEEEEESTGSQIPDWLLESSDRNQMEIETKISRPPREATVEVFIPEHETDTPDSNKETETQKKELESPKFGQKKAASSRDAAANLLKNFFKGGR